MDHSKNHHTTSSGRDDQNTSDSDTQVDTYDLCPFNIFYTVKNKRPVKRANVTDDVHSWYCLQKDKKLSMHQLVKPLLALTVPLPRTHQWWRDPCWVCSWHHSGCSLCVLCSCWAQWRSGCPKADRCSRRTRWRSGTGRRWSLRRGQPWAEKKRDRIYISSLSRPDVYIKTGNTKGSERFLAHIPLQNYSYRQRCKFEKPF